jgi:hypothetical protein
MSEPTLAGDWKDDDGEVIDSLLDENTDGAKNPPPATESFSFAGETPSVTTRILGTTIRLASGVVTAGQITTPSQVPVQVLTPDANRKSLHIHCNAIAADGTSAGLGSDVVRFSDDPGKLRSGHGSPGIVTSQPIDGIPHTGAVFIFAPETNNNGGGGFMDVWVTGVTI